MEPATRGLGDGGDGGEEDAVSWEPSFGGHSGGRWSREQARKLAEARRAERQSLMRHVTHVAGELKVDHLVPKHLDYGPTALGFLAAGLCGWGSYRLLQRQRAAGARYLALRTIGFVCGTAAMHYMVHMGATRLVVAGEMERGLGVHLMFCGAYNKAMVRCAKNKLCREEALKHDVFFNYKLDACTRIRNASQEVIEAAFLSAPENTQAMVYGDVRACVNACRTIEEVFHDAEPASDKDNSQAFAEGLFGAEFLEQKQREPLN